MKKIKKPDLDKALRKIDEAPSSGFGSVNIDVDIPSLKIKKDRITMNLDHDLLAHIKGIAESNEVKYQSLINQTLRTIFLESEKGRLSALEDKVNEIYELLKKTS